MTNDSLSIIDLPQKSDPAQTLADQAAHKAITTVLGDSGIAVVSE